jgi:hypothetical protein
MAGKGGYQAPENPAVQSGPGSLSQRTDGGPASKQAAKYIAGGDYGDGGLMDIQNGAPMEAASTPKPAAPNMAQMAETGNALPSLTGMTQRPWESETTDHNAPQQPDPRTQENNDLINRYLPDLKAALNFPGVPDSYVKFVNYLDSQVK